MPSVYRLTSPSGKSYIGQTTQDFNTRWSQHKKISNTHCRALKAALIKYGPDTFKTEVLLECDDDQLDMFETKMIKLYNTLSPNGYNLDEGGSARRNFTDETKKLMRASAKNASKFIEHNKNLPDYVSVVSNDSKIIGYRIAHHPKCKDTYFKNPKKSTDENLADTLEFLKKVINDESPKKRDLPKYIGQNANGYYIKYRSKSGKIVNRTFQNQSISLKKRLRQAKKALLELIENDNLDE